MKIAIVKCKNSTYRCKTNIDEVDIDDLVVIDDGKFCRIGCITNIYNCEAKCECLYRITRKVTKEEIKIYKKTLQEEEKIIKKVSNLIKEEDLNMSVIDAFYTINKDQLIITYVSDNRVDFRELAKKLAYQYKTRIELRQIGIRDKAKDVSGIGQCGRKICCSSFLNDLDSVSISMAKNQKLALNPSKINGLCGRLLCCLNYENDLYEENKVDMPSVGDEIKTKDGIGKVSSVDIPNRKYVYIDENNTKIEVKMKDLNNCNDCKKCKK